MAQEAFLFPRRIFFGDCDLLGIAFTGRITNFAIEALEAFWDELLDGCGWLYLLTEEKIAIPFVNLTFDFMSPVRAGMPLVSEVRVQQVSGFASYWSPRTDYMLRMPSDFSIYGCKGL